MNTMKKIICLVIVLALSSCMVLTAAAETEAEFVPSVTYKEGLLIKEALLEDEDVASCLEITNVKQAKEGTTDITQEARDLLIEVYEALEAGEMKLPVEDGYVVRELVDVSFMEEGCVQKDDHADKGEILGKAGTVIKVTFELGVAADDEVVIMAYVNEEWVEAVEVVNNGDGTVTASFEDLCPIAICVK